MKHVFVAALIGLGMSGCFYSGPPPQQPLPLAPEQHAEVDAIRTQATAITKVARKHVQENLMDAAVQADIRVGLSRGAGQGETSHHAGAAIDLLNRNVGRPPTWLQDARNEVSSAEAALQKMMPADQKTCSDEVFRTALPKPCEQVLSSAAAEVAHAKELFDRAMAAHDLAKKAVLMDGRDVTVQVANSINSCAGTEAECTNMATPLLATSKVGANAGLAANLAARVRAGMKPTEISALEGDVTYAEKVAARAMDEAQKIAAVHAEEQKKMDAEAQPISDATTACTSNEPACKGRCDKGEMLYCLAWAVRLENAKPPRLQEARAVFQKSCDGGVQHACASIAPVDQQIQAAAAQVDGLWREVTDVGDNLATKHHQTEMFARMATRPYQQRQLQQMRMINQAIISEQYCPAKSAFLQGASGLEFGKRAAHHCKEEAPTGQGLSGADVTLTSECTQVYATPCP